MALVLDILIVLGAAAAAFAAFAAIRRAARGPLIREATRVGPMPTVVGTFFAVLLAFVILAAFQTYNGAKSGAASEANALLDMARSAALFPAPERDALRSEFVCYGRAVVDQEWPAMRAGRSSPLVDYWVSGYRAEFGRLTVRSPREQVAFQDLLNQAVVRTTGRQQRLSDDTPTVPTPLWLVLIFAGFVAAALQLFMTDPREHLLHGLSMAGVAAVVAAGLVMVSFLDHPYQHHVGGIQPTAMRRTLDLIHDLEPGLMPPCSITGRPA